MLDFLEIDQSKRKVGLDIVRSLAILLVLYFHADYIFYDSLPAKVGNLLHWTGYLGVDIFFVLSGFLIGGLLIKDLRNGVSFKVVKTFLVRRWLRTLPNYYFTLLLYIGIAMVLKDTMATQLHAFWVFDVKYSLVKYFFFLQNAIPPYQNFFIQSWSLTVEELAYFAMAIVVLFKRKSNLLHLFLFLFSISIVVKLLLFYCANVTHTFVLYRLHSIFIGLCFAAVYHRYNSSINKHKNKLLSLAVGLFALASIGHILFETTAEGSPAGPYIALVLNLCFVSLLPYFNNISGINKRIKFLFTLFSVLSYSIYLNHFIALLIADYVNLKIPLGQIGQGLLYLFLTIFFSIFQYKFIELPFMKYRKKITRE